MTGLSSYNHVNMTTQQLITNDDVNSVGDDTFHIMTTHFNVSQLEQTTTEEESYQCGTFITFNVNPNDIRKKFGT
jgi:hypothetical protein